MKKATGYSFQQSYQFPLMQSSGKTYTISSPPYLFPRKHHRPLVTFAVPVYNPPANLFRAMLESVIRQAEIYGNSEFLLQDDASPDPEIPRIAREYAAKYPALLFYARSPQNERLIAARKRLLDRAKGKYMLLFDHDDILLPFDMERIIGKMEADPGLLCNYGRKWFFKKNGPTQTSHGFPYSPFTSLFAMTQLQNGAIFRTESLRSCKVYDDIPPGLEGTDDLVLFSRLALHGRCEMESEIRSFAYDQEHRDTSTQQHLEQNVLRLVKPYQKVFDHLVRGIFPEDEKTLPLAELLGAVCFIHRANQELCEKIVAWAAERFPADSGLRRYHLMFTAVKCSRQKFHAEWERVLADFPGDEARMLILFSALPLARKRNLISPEQEKFLSNLAQKFQTPPKCITDAWNSLKSSGKIS